MLKELVAKSMLHYHTQTFSTNWDANIYRGCEHNCQYCFAQYSHRYLNTKEFFEDIFVKSNAAEILAVELGKKKWMKYPVNVCGISDCYQPAEADYKIMPKVIKAFILNKNPLVVVTKSTLILRDLELIKELNKLTEVSIIASVSTLDEEKRTLIEPNTASTLERLKMLNEFRKIGCKTAVLLMPIIPFISDSEENLDDIFRITKEYSFDSITAWPLHLRGKTKDVFFSFLIKHFPELLPKFNAIYKSGNVSEKYRINIKKRISKLRKKYQFFSAYKPTQPLVNKLIQPRLFE